MAPDVTLYPFYILAQILLFVAKSATDEERLSLVTSPLNLEENLFFELVEPREIAYAYKIRPAKDFGTAFNQTYRHVELVPTVPLHACSEITNTLYVRDNIAFIERGGCSFLSKTINAEKAGALAAVITDHQQTEDRMIDMIGDDTERTTYIPAFYLLGKDGYMIRSTLERLNWHSTIINIPINVTRLASTHIRKPPWSLW